MKIVVFDLDETLGYFTEYGIFWDSLNKFVQIKNKKEFLL
jgi:phosphoserine phosphatase